MRCFINLIKNPSIISGIISQGAIGKSFLSNAKILSSNFRELKLYSTKTKNEEKTFTPVYHMPMVQYIAALNKQKKVMAATTCICTPGAFVLESIGVLPPQFAIMTGIIGACFTALVSSVSWLTKDAIGIIYISKDLETIKLSTVNFSGDRVEVYIASKDWVFLSDIARSYTSKIYLNTTSYNTDQTWKLFHRTGIVLDRELFQDVIGTI